MVERVIAIALRFATSYRGLAKLLVDLFGKNRVWIICFLPFFSASHAVEVATKKAGPVAILVASDAEFDCIRPKVVGSKEEVCAGRRYLTGEIDRHPVVVCVTGVGKVNAACATTLLLEHYSPSMVLVIGVAGALNSKLHFGDMVVGDFTVQVDVGRVSDGGFETKVVINPIDGSENPQEFPGEKRALDVLRADAFRTRMRSCKTIYGKIATDDAFIASAKTKESLARHFGADAIDMESGAVAQVCWQQQTSFLAIRGISDHADALASSDVDENVAFAMKGPVEAAQSIVKGLTVLP